LTGNLTTTYRSRLGVLLVSALLVSPGSLAQTTWLDIPIDGTPHRPEEIFTLLEQSSIRYEIALIGDEDSRNRREDLPLVSELLTLLPREEGGYLLTTNIPDSAFQLLDSAVSLYRLDMYDEAIALHLIGCREFPHLHQFPTLLGDNYYSQDKFDSAITWFNRALDINSGAYQTHWFAADAYWEKGDTDKALYHITRAHLFNRNYDIIKERLQQMRLAAGQLWQEWGHEPIYRLVEIEGGVRVESDARTLLYALVKALWEYEPLYAEAMWQPGEILGNVNLGSEREGVLALSERLMAETPFLEIALAGHLNLFIIYEYILVNNPTFIFLLPDDAVDALIAYIETYH